MFIFFTKLDIFYIDKARVIYRKIRQYNIIHSECDCGSTFTPRGTVGLHSLPEGLWDYIRDCESAFIPLNCSQFYV
jgi:hypothetical protein